MEYSFSRPTTWPAASSASTNVREQIESSTRQAGAEKQPNLNPRREMYPKEQWLALKPIIQQLYVNEGQTFNEVAQYLHEYHNFSPTKKQFTRKISEWGFEKNVKRDERRAILESLDAKASAVEFEARILRGRRLDKAKIERWRKREGIGCGGSRTGLTPAPALGLLEGTLNLNDLMCSLSSENALESLHGIPEAIPAEFFDHAEQLQSRPVYQVPTINPWELVDVVGSPGLTGLIGALTIDLCDEIPSLDLSATSSKESEDIYDLMNLGDAGNESLSKKVKKPKSPGSYQPSVSFSIAALHTYFSYQSQRCMPGPLDELYPFPESTRPKSLFATPITEHQMSDYSLRIKEIEYRKKFKTLKSMKHLEIIDLAETIENIAWRHYELDQYRLAEIWWRRFITACLAIPGYQPFEVLRACLWVVDNVRRQGKYKEALNLHQGLHEKIMKLVGPEHELAIISREKLAMLRGCFGEIDSELAIRRELIQISLCRFGIRSRTTVSILLDLGFALIRDRQYREGETILCLWVQLNFEMSRCEDRDTLDAQNFIETMASLAFSLSQQRRYEDSKCALNTTERWFTNVIRMESLSCWNFFREKASILKSEGRLLEGEEILRGVLKYALDEVNNTTLGTMVDLADLLEETGQEAEAITLREKGFVMVVEIYGIGNWYSRWDCEQLGFCYARQGRYDDAILHFQQTIEKVALSNEDDINSRSAYIERIQACILGVKEMKEEARKEQSESDTSALADIAMSSSQQ